MQKKSQQRQKCQPLCQPIVILMRPQIGENIGMAARAMFNCGLSELRIVKPREKWPNEKAMAAAKKAEIVIEKAMVFASLEEAVADCSAIYACSARLRGRNIPIISPVQAVQEILEKEIFEKEILEKEILEKEILEKIRKDKGREVSRSALLFGPENNGLDNDSLAMADRIVHAELNQECPSLNLAQAVFMLAWEWWKIAHGEQEAARKGVSKGVSKGVIREGSPELANRGEMLSFLVRLEGELMARGFFRSAEQRPEIRKNLHALAMRARMSKQELRTLQGVVSVLAKK